VQKRILRFLNKNIVNALEEPIFPALNKINCSKYRYPRSKASYILRTAENIYLAGHSIQSILKSCNNEKEARSNIVDFAVGIGPNKQVYFCAILDSQRIWQS